MLVVNILNVAFSEARTARRQGRFWTCVVVIMLLTGIGYSFSCLGLQFIAPYTPTNYTPFYLLGSIDPTFFLVFQMAALLLAFDSSHQQVRNRIAEVLDSKPISNIQYFTGRILGFTGLLWFLAAILTLSACTLGLVVSTAGFGWSEPFQIHSMLNLLLLDLPVMLLIWCTFTVFLSSLIRVRIFVVAIGILAMFAWFYVALEVPYSLRAIISPSSNDVLFISDLLPQFPKWETVAARVATVLGAIGFIVTAALLHKRRDSFPTSFSILATGGAMLSFACLYALAFTGALAPLYQASKWKQAHQAVEWDGHIDVTELSGDVLINPGNLLDIHLVMKLDIHDLNSKTLVFSFNPSMRVRQIELNDVAADFTFEDGLLRIDHPEPAGGSPEYSLRIRADGVPNQRFAYFDSAVDYQNSSEVPMVASSLLGTDASVFTNRYVALMPGVHWYPTPGPVNGDYKSVQQGRDYFRVSLSVQLTPPKWSLVAHGSELGDSDTLGRFIVRPTKPVHELGLFASEFESVEVEIGGINCSIHLHKRHAKNLNLLSQIESQALIEQFEDLVQGFTSKGISIAHRGLALVEVPRRLRTTAGGWRMNTANLLPGVVLMKEHGFPRAQLKTAMDSVAGRAENEDELAQLLRSVLTMFFEGEFESENVALSLPERFWSHSTSAQGAHAQALDQVIRSLIAMMFELEFSYSSIYSTFHIADITTLNVEPILYAAYSGYVDRRYVFGTYQASGEYTHRASVWSSVEETTLSDLPTTKGLQYDLELLQLKCQQIALALLMANDNSAVADWLDDFRDQFAGKNYALEDLLASARTRDVVVEPFLTEWLETSDLPGFIASNASILRIEDDEVGNPQWLTSVDVRNATQTTGIVHIDYPTEDTQDWIAPNWRRSNTVSIKGQSAKKINLLTPYQVKAIRINPYLSLNRIPLSVAVEFEPEEPTANHQVPPFIEDSNWVSHSNGIIVDDLDQGFQVFQTSPNFGRPISIGPMKWFRGSTQFQLDKDAGLPAWGRTFSEQGIWARTHFSSAYGAFRRTTAQLLIRKTNPEVRFAAEIPDSSTWKLEYHLPAIQLGYRPEIVYSFVIGDGKNEWQAVLDYDENPHGWREIGEFSLNKGTVTVDLVGVRSEFGWGYVYADAIRWSPIGRDDSN